MKDYFKELNEGYHHVVDGDYDDTLTTEFWENYKKLYREIVQEIDSIQNLIEFFKPIQTYEGKLIDELECTEATELAPINELDKLGYPHDFLEWQQEFSNFNIAINLESKSSFQILGNGHLLKEMNGYYDLLKHNGYLVIADDMHGNVYVYDKQDSLSPYKFISHEGPRNLGHLDDLYDHFDFYKKEDGGYHNPQNLEVDLVMKDGKYLQSSKYIREYLEQDEDISSLSYSSFTELVKGMLNDLFLDFFENFGEYDLEEEEEIKFNEKGEELDSNGYTKKEKEEVLKRVKLEEKAEKEALSLYTSDLIKKWYSLSNSERIEELENWNEKFEYTTKAPVFPINRLEFSSTSEEELDWSDLESELTKLVGIKQLIIRGVDIEYFDFNYWDENELMESIEASNCEIEFIGRNLFESYLLHLNLSNNPKLEELDTAMVNAKSLESLNISNTAIKSFPDSFFEKVFFENFKELIVFNTPLSTNEKHINSIQELYPGLNIITSKSSYDELVLSGETNKGDFEYHLEAIISEVNDIDLKHGNEKLFDFDLKDGAQRFRDFVKKCNTSNKLLKLVNEIEDNCPIHVNFTQVREQRESFVKQLAEMQYPEELLQWQENSACVLINLFSNESNETPELNLLINDSQDLVKYDLPYYNLLTAHGYHVVCRDQSHNGYVMDVNDDNQIYYVYDDLICVNKEQIHELYRKEYDFYIQEDRSYHNPQKLEVEKIFREDDFWVQSPYIKEYYEKRLEKTYFNNIVEFIQENIIDAYDNFINGYVVKKSFKTEREVSELERNVLSLNKELVVIENLEERKKNLESNKELHAEIQKAPNFFIDERDHTVYRTIRVGDFEWLADNVRYDNGNNCYFAKEFDMIHTAEEGLLYPIEHANDACPEGWRLPNHEDWGNLFTGLGGGYFNVESNEWIGGRNISLAEVLDLGGGSGFDNHNVGKLYRKEMDGDIRTYGYGSEGYFWSASKSSENMICHIEEEEGVYLTSHNYAWMALPIRCVRKVETSAIKKVIKENKITKKVKEWFKKNPKKIDFDITMSKVWKLYELNRNREDLNHCQKMLLLAQMGEDEVSSNGLDGLFYNHDSTFSREVMNAFSEIGSVIAAMSIKKAIKLFPDQAVPVSIEECREFLENMDETQSASFEVLADELEAIISNDFVVLKDNYINKNQKHFKF